MMRALYWTAKVKIDEDEFLETALAEASKEYTCAISMGQTRAELKVEDFQADNVFWAMVKY